MSPCRADYIFTAVAVLNFSSHLALLPKDSRYTFPRMGLARYCLHCMYMRRVPPNLNSLMTTVLFIVSNEQGGTVPRKVRCDAHTRHRGRLVDSLEVTVDVIAGRAGTVPTGHIGA